MNDILDGLTLTAPVFLRNLLVYPLRGLADNACKLLSIDEVHDDESGGFHELPTAEINLISFGNDSGDPVLMLDGEEITGALQNRIIAASTYVEPHTARNVEVICAEEGRWSELSAFRTGYCSYPGIRALLSRRSKKENSMQQSVWKEIERKLTVTRTLSSTSSMHDIYNNLQEEVNRYLEDFEGLDQNTSGFIGVAGDEILGCDIFNSPSTYRKFENKLLRSYAIDAIEHRKPGVSSGKTADFFAEIKRVFQKRKGIGKPGHFSLASNGLSGQGIAHHGRIVHLSAFPE